MDDGEHGNQPQIVPSAHPGVGPLYPAQHTRCQNVREWAPTDQPKEKISKLQRLP